MSTEASHLIKAERFFVTGGTLKPGDPSYIQRPADDELWQHLQAGDYCYVLTPRQMGKSSLMARTAVRLREAGDLAAMVDLTQIGSGASTEAEAWFYGVVKEIHKGLGVAASLREWWQENSNLPPVQRFVDYFREVALAGGEARRVVFVDEIDSTLKLPWAADFFAAIRACFNHRATEPVFERLSFVLLGVATPNQLITDPQRTPFNVGQQIALTDFSHEEARPLVVGLRRDSEDPEAADELLGKILAWTGGQPFLTQLLCRTVAERGVDTRLREVDELVSETLLTPTKLREEVHLKNIGDQLTAKPDVRRRLLLYRRVLQGKQVPDQPASPACSTLKLSGVVKVDELGLLTVRNKVYKRVFGAKWTVREMAPDLARWGVAAAATWIILGGLFWVRLVQTAPYIEQLRLTPDDYGKAAAAHRRLVDHPLFPRKQADELLADYWESRALRSAELQTQDNSLLEELQALRLSDSTERRHRVAQAATAFEGLVGTVRADSRVNVVAFSPDGRTLVTGGDGNSAQLWDIRSGTPLSKPLMHSRWIETVAFSPDGKTVLTGSGDRTARLWDARSGTRLVGPLLHNDWVLAVAFSPDGKTVLTASADCTARIWDARSGTPLAKLLTHKGWVSAVAFSPDGNTILTGSGDGIGRFWDARSSTQKAKSLMHDKWIRAVTFSPNGSAVLIVTSDNRVWMWNSQSETLLASQQLPQNDAVETVAFSPDGLKILAWAGAWLHVYSVDPSGFTHISSHSVGAELISGHFFPTNCSDCVYVAAKPKINFLRIYRIHYLKPEAEPIKGDPEALLEEWQQKLALKFNESMNIVPRYPLLAASDDDLNAVRRPLERGKTGEPPPL